MNLVNNVTLIGHLGADPVIKDFGDGKLMAKFRIATTEYYKEKNEFKTKTYWHNIVAWGNSAKKVQEKCHKGSEVILNGKLTNREFENDKGEKIWFHEVLVNQIIIRAKAA
ncbi:MAG: single-stranded DNA-binding protein [Bacteroidales bacterium]|jgi:single-strand DNA-binding protein|nr:single-stranded DNA-binding protein [Bacteroidales bacterium]MCK9499135.1 single-stranded DNA-binding protein [Bacteroidales bacterium]MDY0315597.1 single-stranded DNA-binding protein [Bacteroidales bacterium]NLB85813.1 single-stranded DNA-binding protein [Bacteroidales bacterium]